MTTLSPAAQAVIDAALSTDGYVDFANPEKGINSLRLASSAAAFRAVANAVAPEAMPHRRKIRAELLAIATELEAAS